MEVEPPFLNVSCPCFSLEEMSHNYVGTRCGNVGCRFDMNALAAGEPVPFCEGIQGTVMSARVSSLLFSSPSGVRVALGMFWWPSSVVERFSIQTCVLPWCILLLLFALDLLCLFFSPLLFCISRFVIVSFLLCALFVFCLFCTGGDGPSPKKARTTGTVILCVFVCVPHI